MPGVESIRKREDDRLIVREKSLGHLLRGPRVRMPEGMALSLVVHACRINQAVNPENAATAKSNPRVIATMGSTTCARVG